MEKTIVFNIHRDLMGRDHNSMIYAEVDNHKNFELTEEGERELAWAGMDTKLKVRLTEDGELFALSLNDMPLVDPVRI